MFLYIIITSGVNLLAVKWDSNLKELIFDHIGVRSITSIIKVLDVEEVKLSIQQNTRWIPNRSLATKSIHVIECISH